VPNRGSDPQQDIFLNGVPYLQAINDVTTPGQTVGIHVEPGIWMLVPSTTAPQEVSTVVRMASIPHGTTIEAQGTWNMSNGAPQIPSVDITPFVIPPSGIPSDPQVRITPKFPSQTLTNTQTARIPQDLTSFNASGTITQAILDNPNIVLTNHNEGLTFIDTLTISVSTQPKSPPPIKDIPAFGGGTDNIAFLLGDGNVPLPIKPNAHAIQMTATFWISTVEHIIHIPIFRPGQSPLLLKPQVRLPGEHVPVFSVTPPKEITSPITLKVRSTQIQYSQTVLLNFATLSWPHVSVATLVPAGAVVVPPSAW
jgi:hypothetical protein